MIEFRKGNVLDADAEALVNSVNCVGVMGRGVALQFKRAWPANYKAYAVACQRGEVQPGKMFVFTTGLLANPKYIINFPTKRHWRGKAHMQDIEQGLLDLLNVIRQYRIRSIALPPLGAGLGGLDWKEVRKRIENTLGTLNDVFVIVYEPTGDIPLPKSMQRHPKPRMTAGRAALISLMARYVEGLLDPSVTLLELHKLLYLMQEAGENLRLQFVQGQYGPYAVNLRHVLMAMESYYIAGYGTGGDKPNKSLRLLPGALTEAQKVLANNHTTQKHFAKVADLIAGFESPHGLELLATVHWIVVRQKPTTFDELVDQFYMWHSRKAIFTRRQIEIALKRLEDKGWIEFVGRTHPRFT
ncbi:type II toxin-antitoxin system antitoxin DNA ADP-ribosyl glycohydrolase DarG [Thermus scotoductus]|uniref:type II toxin-antitoxin system antitoxin DNA ADP-ribosyl glycohydrolase DarG n=1 Tax=Thermus scotoductus TaxID=37636 RepID=UPI0009D67DDF|nr:macro domain-containing protein [Thermus scotoductus]